VSNINVLLVRAFYDLALGCRGDALGPRAPNGLLHDFRASRSNDGQLVAGVGHEVLVTTLFERPVRKSIKKERL
jgi:hypothetical protein